MGMMMVRRRTVLSAVGLAVAGPAVGGAVGVAGGGYPSNSALVRGRGEGVDFARRARRCALVDDDLVRRSPVPLVTVIAAHGGGIEPGTSELCLAIAGYHPATMVPLSGSAYDYWMFESLLSSGSEVLHV